MKLFKNTKLTKFDVLCIQYTLIIATLAAAGFGIYHYIKQPADTSVVYELDENTQQTLEGMSDAEFEYFFSNYIKEARDSQEIMAIVDASLKTQPKEKHLDIVDALIYNQGLHAARYQTNLVANKDHLAGINLNSETFIEKITDKLTRNIIQQIYDNHFYIKRVQNTYLVYIDRDFYLNRYREFLDEDMISFYELSNQIDDNVIYTNTGIDVSKLLENMFALQKMALTTKHMIVVQNCASAYMQNLYVFLHMMDANEYTNEDGSFNEAVRLDYENFIEANPENPISAILEEILIRVDDMDGKIDDNFYTYQENIIQRHIDELIETSYAHRLEEHNGELGANHDQETYSESSLSKLAEELNSGSKEFDKTETEVESNQNQTELSAEFEVIETQEEQQP